MGWRDRLAHDVRMYYIPLSSLEGGLGLQICMTLHMPTCESVQALF